MPGKHNAQYEQLLQKVRGDLRGMVKSGSAPAQSVANVKALARALARLQRADFEDVEVIARHGSGVYKAVLSAMFLLEEPATPTEIRDALLLLGFDLRRYSFPMGVFHNVLKYYVEHGRISWRMSSRGKI